MIYCLVGKSGTGKDTLYRALLNIGHDLFSPITPYTTRPMRVNEVDGETYYFVSDAQYMEMEKMGEVVEKRQYNTVHGIWTYFTRKFEINTNKNYLCITTLEGAKGLIRCYGEETVVLIYLYLQDYERLQRCISRESRQTHPNLSEVCRRYLADEDDFTEEKLKSFKHIVRIDTGAADVDSCTKAVLAITQKY